MLQIIDSRRGLVKEDHRCPICKRTAQKKLSKGTWMLCQIHGLIEATLIVAFPQSKSSVA